ncbi:hypothetical protein ACP46_gp07 [Rhizobium phage RHEph06]|uniref:Uncharacterized protein n=2 Tax=Kleczkowskavirus RHEph4 TaxID=1921526 RepID=L7TMC5_9CAUD|nr:hypothetical protein ACP46_gp07 [Rhizobium phage RHEph06]YP_009598448.1 hypothetical protein FDH25_gp06 [Rhizobium phage RHEph04]AGC35692.1 hypothetical protein RHEph04_gp006 [Rhizobium phage RHEph04]AGC35849.1 hypothetical protein RHEph06_gp007 [Rhizobium phage RHEph06]
MECKFVPGQHVLCVQKQTLHPLMLIESGFILPEVGKVYTVSKVIMGELRAIPCIELEELGQQLVSYMIGDERYQGCLCYDHRSFKPLPKLKVKDFLTDLVPA